jgi:hypothetical protein
MGKRKGGRQTLSIWMNATLRYMYAWFPHIKLRLKKNPIGTIARTYTLPVILTVFRASSSVVVRARTWVAMVAKTKCHVVRKIGNAVQR